MRLRRRRFLAAAAVAGGLNSCTIHRGPWRFFTEEEMETMCAAADCLIPPDDFPGGAEAGVPVFLDRQLSGHYRKHQKLYREGLAALDRVSQETARKRFCQLDRDAQTKLLKSVERGQPPAAWGSSPDPRLFFATMLAHAHQGFYGDPRHGGNRGQLGYLMLGVPATNVRGRSQHDSRLVQISGVQPPGGNL